MSRQNKFRAWDKNKKIFLPVDTYAIITNDFNALGVMIKDFEDYKEGEYLYENTQSVSQFTGIMDQNDNDIYEGDILDNYWQIHFYRGMFVAVPCGQIPNMDNSNQIFWVASNDHCVIGNVFQNPELLDK